MVSVIVTTYMSDGARRDTLYRGDIIVFKQIPAMVELAAEACHLVSSFLGEDPEMAHQTFERQDYLNRVGELQRTFTNSPDIRNLFRQTLIQCGIDEAATFWDWFPLRVQPPADGPKTRATMGLPPHRDTWYGNIFSQTNWWTPIMPVEAGRSLTFYPAYWFRKIDNSSDQWDLDAYRKKYGVRSKNGKGAEIEVNDLPQPTGNFDASSEIEILPDPGDMICFSAAHLHAGMPNRTGLTRFSTEIRTINKTDFFNNRGAPNMDSFGSGESSEDFHSIKDGTPLQVS